MIKRESRGVVRSTILLGGLLLVGCEGGGLLGSSEGAPLDAQVAHPNGAVLQVLSIRTNDDWTLVNVRVLNGRERDVTLNSGRENSYILGDGGEKLFLVPAAGNPKLAVPAGQTMDGALVFRGALAGSEQATLVLNEHAQSDNQHTSSPRFQIALPLNGAFGGGRIAEASALSNMRPNSASALRAATVNGSSLGSGGQGTSSLQTVEALKSELGATQTDRGTVVSLPGDVTFEFDKATIRDSARQSLDRLAQLIQIGPAGQITIEGHTDAKGDDDYNKRLSEQRADAVRAYLIGKSVEQGRLRTIGLGEMRPVSPNVKADGSDDEAGRQRNRRVEVVLPNSSS